MNEAFTITTTVPLHGITNSVHIHFQGMLKGRLPASGVHFAGVYSEVGPSDVVILTDKIQNTSVPGSSMTALFKTGSLKSCFVKLLSGL